jgi:hypothetical protein
MICFNATDFPAPANPVRKIFLPDLKASPHLYNILIS